MIKDYIPEKRVLKNVELQADLVVIGGGLAGVCCAVTAARLGVKVILVQDRPILGGNCSSEVRLWVLGATSHMGNNNRWAREGGLLDEIMLENAYRNPEGNPLIFDTILLEKVVIENNITLLLNTAVYDLEKSDIDTIESVTAFCSQNSTTYKLYAPLFTDASGDGIAGFLAGAAFRIGAESKEEFGEKFAPDKSYGELLGHSIYFYSKDVGRKVKFVPPSYALTDIKQIPRYKKINTKDYGCRLWWIEYGGRLDTIHETEKIKWELWKVVYGVWDYIKNSGEFPEAETMTLEWVGTIPGKRESRRFEGDYILKQQDIIEQSIFEDTVAFGGWSIDLHPADGVYSEKPGCNQWHSKGIFGIPYRCYFSRNINNLFLAGRIISASHVAFGSTRVMATNAHGAQAVAVAAYIAKKYQVNPREVGQKYLFELQEELLKIGQHLPHQKLKDKNNLVHQALVISASSTLSLSEIPASGVFTDLKNGVAQMLPFHKGQLPTIEIEVNALEDTSLIIELRKSSKIYNHTPDVSISSITYQLVAGKQNISIVFDKEWEEDAYGFILFHQNPLVHLPLSNQRITGILSVFNKINPAVSNYGKQTPTEDIGVDTFEFWCPERRPAGKNLAMKFGKPIQMFKINNLLNGIQRPVSTPNAWVAAFSDKKPSLKLEWKSPIMIKEIQLSFDTDFDHPLENVLMHNPEEVMPFCIKNYKVFDDEDKLIYQKKGNYLTLNTIKLDQPLNTKSIRFELEHPSDDVPAALFEIRCYTANT
ncbi:FAD-dependent oxidoreductase [Pedobacter puniceum]|uniref:FAD-dependent oxidoreductase n=1 Tax=Pedobacter puniceum TaxID=2666136 RepID=A0A7K0FLS4_9SPHI|nr:FAD-dependent oxidoreductase [Pedobacter puniceum]MRX46926.1 FAD-dependent oxidoreductase [Pedobacter puniceum]